MIGLNVQLVQLLDTRALLSVASAAVQVGCLSAKVNCESRRITPIAFFVAPFTPSTEDELVYALWM